MPVLNDDLKKDIGDGFNTCFGAALSLTSAFAGLAYIMTAPEDMTNAIMTNSASGEFNSAADIIGAGIQEGLPGFIQNGSVGMLLFAGSIALARLTVLEARLDNHNPKAFFTGLAAGVALGFAGGLSLANSSHFDSEEPETAIRMEQPLTPLRAG